MSLLLGIGRRRGLRTTAGTPPFSVPTVAPYNVAGYLNIPSPMGAYSAVHPSVWDFGPGTQWNGYRYWMAHTPYDNTNDNYENPCVVASNDGWTWVVPAGLTNPIYPMPAGGENLGGPFNSDTDLLWDAQTNELVLVYRELKSNNRHVWHYARSSDGSTWPALPTPFDLPIPGQLLSPALVQVSASEWRAYTIFRDVMPMRLEVWSATSLEGTWAKLGDLTGFETLIAEGENPWHLDVIHDGDFYRMLLDLGPAYLDKGDGLIAASSVDGIAWTVNNTPVMTTGVADWDSVQLYRSTFVPHENGTHYRVWYSAEGTVGALWHTGYTELPMALWPDPTVATTTTTTTATTTTTTTVVTTTTTTTTTTTSAAYSS